MNTWSAARRWRASLCFALAFAAVGGGWAQETAPAAPAAPAGDTSIVVDGSTTVGPIAAAFAEHYMATHPGVNITVSMSGSGNGVRGLINGEIQVCTSSREMTPDEIAAARSRGVNPVEHVIAIDGLAIVVHPSNPVEELSLAQVRDIYAGRITNWSAVGGPDMGIVVISRDTNSGTYESFEKLVMGEERITQSAEYVGSSGALRARVQETPAAIGYVGQGFLDDTVKALVIDGVLPEEEEVRSGEYPIARPLYMYTNGEPEPGTHLHAFVTLSQTEEGRDLIESIGFVPLAEN